MIEKYIKALQKVALSDDVSLAGSDTVLGLLYECYNENHPYQSRAASFDGFLNDRFHCEIPFLK